MANKELIEAIIQAMEYEKESLERYRRMASQAEESETRLLLEQIAREEENHFNQLSKRLKAIRLLG